MPKKPEILTAEELAKIERRGAKAREKARRLIETADPAEDAAILARAEADPENPPMTDEQLARLRPAHEVVPGLVAAQLRRGPGRPKSPSPKQQVTLRLDADVIAGWRATGKGWQVRINDLLRRSLRSGRKRSDVA